MDFKKMTKTEVSLMAEKTPKTIGNWRKIGLPTNPDGRTYRSGVVIEWLRERDVKLASQGESQESEKWLTKWRKERAHIAEIQRKELEGRLIPVETVEEQFTARAYEFSRSLMLMPRRIASRLAIKSKKPLQEVMEIVEQEARRILENYSRAMPELKIEITEAGLDRLRQFIKDPK